MALNYFAKESKDFSVFLFSNCSSTCTLYIYIYILPDLVFHRSSKFAHHRHLSVALPAVFARVRSIRFDHRLKPIRLCTDFSSRHTYAHTCTHAHIIYLHTTPIGCCPRLPPSLAPSPGFQAYRHVTYPCCISPHQQILFQGSHTLWQPHQVLY